MTARASVISPAAPVARVNDSTAFDVVQCVSLMARRSHGVLVDYSNEGLK
jgi:hypothetical protein